jgi:hypothetical protein
MKPLPDRPKSAGQGHGIEWFADDIGYTLL